MDNQAPRKPNRLIPVGVALVGLAAVLIAGIGLAQRIERFNVENPPKLYYFLETDQTEFSFASRPVRITDDLDESGAGTLTVQYGETVLALPVEVPNDIPLDGLDRHRDWFRLLIFADGQGLGAREFSEAIATDQIDPRLVAVTRNPMSEDIREGRFGMEVDDNWGWGEVMRDRWTFTFHEFLPAGGFESETLRFPESGKAFYRRQVQADLNDQPEPERAKDELREGTWQFQASLKLMNRPPAITMENQALRATGWTLPVASSGVLLMFFGIAWTFAPARRTA